MCISDVFTLMDEIEIISHALYCIIDINYYPVYETRLSNLRHRPMGIGVQGLADVFLKMDLPLQSSSLKIENSSGRDPNLRISKQSWIKEVSFCKSFYDISQK